jgi:hypothetical protein
MPNLPTYFACPYCGLIHAEQNDTFGGDIVCCGERGHVVPIIDGDCDD